MHDLDTANLDGVRRKHQTHLEIFSAASPEEINAFLDNTGNVTSGKRYLLLKRNALIRHAARPDELTGQSTGVTVVLNRVLPMDYHSTLLQKGRRS